MKKIMTTALLVLSAMATNAQPANVAVEEGIYGSLWESMSQWECPEWFKDAKFGIWAHWGPQCQAEDGDWYARFMYYEGSIYDINGRRHTKLQKAINIVNGKKIMFNK